MKILVTNFNRLMTALLVVSGLLATSCGRNNNNNDNNGNTGLNNGINTYCLQVQGQDPRCQGVYGNTAGGAFMNYPTSNGIYNHGQGCNVYGAGYTNAINPQFGSLGCFNSGAYPGTYSQVNMGQFGLNGQMGVVSCDPYSRINQCLAGMCRPVGNGSFGTCY